MCLSCTIEEVTGIELSTDEGHAALEKYREEHEGRIPWPDATPQMEETAAYIAALYANPVGITGGPLHIVTDDFNIGDSNLKWCRDHLEGWESYDSRPAEEARAKVLSLWILDLLDQMSNAARSVTVAIAHGRLQVIDGKVFMPATEFPIREEIRDANDKVIGMRWGFRTRTVDA